MSVYMSVQIGVKHYVCVFGPIFMISAYLLD